MNSLEKIDILFNFANITDFVKIQRKIIFFTKKKNFHMKFGKFDIPLFFIQTFLWPLVKL